MEPEETTAIVFTKFESRFLLALVTDHVMDEKFYGPRPYAKELKQLFIKLVEQCSGATQPAAEEHLNAR